MNPLRTLCSTAAPVLQNAIDTDVIFPARFLLLMDRDGLGKHAFADWRGTDFPLDTAPWKGSEILVVGENFGTGSSREQAVWCLADLGIRCVIGRSFGEIFFSNCFKSGVLPIRLAEGEITQVEAVAQAGKKIEIDVATQEIRLPDGVTLSFDLDAHRKRMLLEGLDDIGLVLEDHAAEITQFEKNRPNWLNLTRDRFDALTGR
ncbi:MAG: 3-isopropylmalate dehydratase small subunit [Rhodobacteraceae bacterium]|nr:3-isopropylmalate dehydratase small subunit [Paracoccaceae bacterium]